jgi:uncharacterized membrane protein
MADFLQTPLASIVLLIALTATLVAVGIYVIAKVRTSTREEVAPTSESMTYFQNLHAQGGLSDEEYRTIKAKLAARLQDELNSTAESG